MYIIRMLCIRFSNQYAKLHRRNVISCKRRITAVWKFAEWIIFHKYVNGYEHLTPEDKRFISFKQQNWSFINSNTSKQSLSQWQKFPVNCDEIKIYFISTLIYILQFFAILMCMNVTHRHTASQHYKVWQSDQQR